MTKSHPIRSLLQRPVLSGRLAQWLLQLSQYEIIAETPTAIRSQVIADLLAQFPGEDNSSILDEVPGEINEVFLAGLADSVWTLKFDGSSTTTSAGAGIVLYKDDGEAVTKSFKFDFPCSNNAAEYEAYLAGLAIAYEMGIKHLRVIGDSNLVDCQARGEFSLKEPSLAPYRALAQKLEAKFNTFEIEHAQRNENRYADALATLGSQIAFEGEEIDVTICKKARPITESLREKFEELPLDQEDWRAPIKAKLISPAVMADLREIKDYTLISGDLYRRLPGGVLARCISIEEAKEKLPEVHEKTCGDGGAISLYRRLQRLGYFWPNMSAEAAEIQSQCPTCQFHYSNEEDVYRLKRLALRYFVEGGTLFRKGFHGEPLRCLSLSESQMVMKETHAGECGEHQGKKRLYQCLLTLGYYWPTMKKDAADFVKTCHTCQVQANLIHTHPTSLQNMATPWPFHTWGLDLIGPINPASGGYIWILVATEYFTKWVEAIPLRRATGAAVANFIREHIITRFGIPYKLITDNGTPFINKDVREVLEHYRVKHRRSTPYYPQGNGQAEATNRMLLRILSKMVFDYGNNWKAHLADVLWAYRSSPKTATGFTPFSLEEPSLVPIRTLIQKLEDKFNTFEIDHAQRIEEPLCGPPRGALARSDFSGWNALIQFKQRSSRLSKPKSTLLARQAMRKVTAEFIKACHIFQATKDLHRMQDDQFNGQESEAAMATFSSTKQVKFHDPQNETIVLLAHASPVIGGSPSPERVSLRLLTDLLEEEAIDGEQGREKEEKEKEEEEEKLGKTAGAQALVSPAPKIAEDSQSVGPMRGRQQQAILSNVTRAITPPFFKLLKTPQLIPALHFTGSHDFWYCSRSRFLHNSSNTTGSNQNAWEMKKYDGKPIAMPIPVPKGLRE
uniref:Uncharacterized protein n=2 Tax=Fagus sylvatica TaxID=28930 RepID=A0A2N9HMF5_FAGSY